MLKKFLLVTSAVAAIAVISPANAAVVIVNSAANSSAGVTGASSGLTLTSGQIFTVSSSLTDLWSAGALPRWSNANGLTGPLLATGSDESGQAAGILIGSNFGLLNQHGITAPFGSLVGEIGGVYQFLGANFNGSAWASGNLNLFYWDSNSGDNTESIAFDVAAVPEPTTWALMMLGFALMGAAMRRRQQNVNVSFG